MYWRATRSFALAAESCVIDADERVALVDAGAANGWRLPRTDVRKGEALNDALQRLLRDDYGLLALRPELFWMYGDSVPEQAGMTGLFVVRHWRQDAAPPALQLSYFGFDALPPGLPPQDAARIRQVAEGRAPFEVC